VRAADHWQVLVPPPMQVSPAAQSPVTLQVLPDVQPAQVGPPQSVSVS